MADAASSPLRMIASEAAGDWNASDRPEDGRAALASRPLEAGDIAVRVYVAGDVRVNCEALAQFLDRSRMNVVGEGPCDDDLATELRHSLPDIVLLDMVAGGSAALVRQLSRLAPNARVIAVGVAEDGDQVVDCAEAGICGYVPLDACLADLVAVIESVVRGEAICSPRIVADLLRRVASLAKHAPSDRVDLPLTTRELQVARLMSNGLTNKEIARDLSIELGTVKNHVHHILRKLGIRRRRDVRLRLREASPTSGRWTSSGPFASERDHVDASSAKI